MEISHRSMSTSGTLKQYGMSKTAVQRRNKTMMKPPQTHIEKQIMKDAGATIKAVIAGIVNTEMVD